MNHDHHAHESNNQMRSALHPLSHSLKDYVPLIAVLGFIFISTVIYVVLQGNTFLIWMNALMGFFFLFFALFKFIDLPGFAEGYHEYDLIAQRFKPYAWTYPFIEVVLAVFYLLGIVNPWLYIFTIIVMAINVASIWIKLARREAFMCMCLSTVLKVPLTTVSLVEYGSMGIMAGVMLAIL
jgi:hypothetical protein